MQVPLELTFRDVEPSDDIKNLVRDKVAKLDQVCAHCTSCRVAIEQPQEHQKSGNKYRVRVEVNVPPGHKIVTVRGPGGEDMHLDLPALIREAFDTERRRLSELVQRQRLEVKRNPSRDVSAFVQRLFEDYGFLETTDGREVYFHRNSVLHGDFDRLAIGTGVHHLEEPGEKGPQATSVQIVDKPGKRASADI